MSRKQTGRHLVSAAATGLALWCVLMVGGCDVEKAAVGERCVVGSDCESGLCLNAVCQLPNQQACADDPYEPNGEREEASLLALGRGYAGLQLCPGDEDWFLIDLAAGARIRLQLRPASSSGPGMLVLRDPGGQPVATESTDSGDGRVSNVYQIATAGTHSVQVASGQGGAGAYSLGVWEELACADLQADDPSEAGPLVEAPDGPFTVEDATLCPDDEDWWTLALGPNDGLRLTLSYEGDTEHRLELHGPGEAGAQELLGEGVPSEDGVELLYARPGSLQAEQVLIRVAPGRYVDTELPYSLAGDVLTNDAGEPLNDSAAGALGAEGIAVPLPGAEAATVQGVLGPGDEDWVRLLMPANHRLHVEGTYALGDGVELLAAVVTADEESLPGGDTEGAEGALTLELDPALDEDGDLLLRLGPELSAGAVAWGSYELNVSSIAIEPDCADDPREDSEPVEVEVESGLDEQVELADGVLCPGDEDVFEVSGLGGSELLAVWLEVAGAPALELGFAQQEVAVLPLEREPIEGGALVAPPSAGALQLTVSWPAGAEPEQAAQYSLHVTRGGGCADEEAGEGGDGNDEVGHPAEAPGDQFAGTSCALDPDYFLLRADPGVALEVTVTTEAEAELEVTLNDSEGAQLDRAQGREQAWSVEALSEGGPDGGLVLGIRLLAGAEAAYTVEVQRAEPMTIEQLQADIFTPACAGCHGADGHATGLMLHDALTSWGGMVGQPTADGARTRVVAGDPDASYLYEKIGVDDPARGERMPRGAPALSAQRISAVRSWILGGALEPGAE